MLGSENGCQIVQYYLNFWLSVSSEIIYKVIYLSIIIIEMNNRLKTKFFILFFPLKSVINLFCFIIQKWQKLFYTGPGRPECTKPEKVSIEVRWGHWNIKIQYQPILKKMYNKQCLDLTTYFVNIPAFWVKQSKGVPSRHEALLYVSKFQAIKRKHVFLFSFLKNNTKY